MKALDLGSGLTLFMFDPPEGEYEGLNFLALVEEGRALLFDTGFKENVETVLAWLGAHGAKPVAAVISHYHQDHADGLGLLPGIETWGGAGFAQTLELCFRSERHASLAPTHIVAGSELVHFGSHAIELFPMPGHSPDSLCAIIDARIVYAADTLLFTNDGQPILPSVHARPVSLHIEAIHQLERYIDLTFVPGHGAPVLEKEARKRDLANRLAYLEAINSEPGIDVDEAQLKCTPKFRGREWHEENWK
jgi:glyoxylase-like metal-dependent hydrolase (beta-lactamase superfamily II)